MPSCAYLLSSVASTAATRCQLGNTPAHRAHYDQALKMNRTVSKKQRRILARQTMLTAAWWEALPTPKPPCLTPRTLETVTGTGMRRLAPALRALGWVRILRRVNGTTKTLWLPPGSPITRRPRGRPPITSYL